MTVTVCLVTRNHERSLDRAIRSAARVATQVVVDTPAGTVQVFAQNIDSGEAIPAAGSSITLSWSPDATFVVDGPETEQEEEASE